MLSLDHECLNRAIEDCDLYRRAGKLRSATGLLTCSLCAAVGELCEILPLHGPPILAEAIGFQDNLTYLAPFDSPEKLQPGLTVVRAGRGVTVSAGRGLLGA